MPKTIRWLRVLDSSAGIAGIALPTLEVSTLEVANVAVAVTDLFAKGLFFAIVVKGKDFFNVCTNKGIGKSCTKIKEK